MSLLTYRSPPCSVGLVWALVALASSGCEADSAGGARPDADSFEAGIETPAQGCTQRDDGEVCAEHMHCFGQRCVDDECGDAIVSAGEACDDGNLAWGDGCDAACAFERPGCPDGLVEADEECDDGNWNDGDECTNLCMLARSLCGNGRAEPGEDCDDGNIIDEDDCSNECRAPAACRDGHLDPGEECDDGNTVDEGDGCTNACELSVCGNGKTEKYETCDDGNKNDGDACPSTCIQGVCGNGIIEPNEVCEGPRVTTIGGKTARRGCSADCRHWVEGDDDPCNKCQNQKCTAYLEDVFGVGLNVVDGCFTKIDPQYGADAADPRFIQSCSDAVDCALVHGCGFTEHFQAAECYCGANAGDDCTSEGASPDAPCAQQWFSAAKAADNVEVQNRFSDLVYASAWAYFLIECYRTQCADVCVPSTLWTSGP